MARALSVLLCRESEASSKRRRKAPLLQRGCAVVQRIQLSAGTPLRHPARDAADGEDPRCVRCTSRGYRPVRRSGPPDRRVNRQFCRNRRDLAWLRYAGARWPARARGQKRSAGRCAFSGPVRSPAIWSISRAFSGSWCICACAPAQRATRRIAARIFTASSPERRRRQGQTFRAAVGRAAFPTRSAERAQMWPIFGIKRLHNILRSAG